MRFAVLVDRGHGRRKHAIQLPDNHVRPHRHALITSWIEQRNSQRLLQGACSLDLSRHFHDEGFHVQTRIINRISKYLAYKKLLERWDG